MGGAGGERAVTCPFPLAGGAWRRGSRGRMRKREVRATWVAPRGRGRAGSRSRVPKPGDNDREPAHGEGEKSAGRLQTVISPFNVFQCENPREKLINQFPPHPPRKKPKKGVFCVVSFFKVPSLTPRHMHREGKLWQELPQKYPPHTPESGDAIKHARGVKNADFLPKFPRGLVAAQVCLAGEEEEEEAAPRADCR